MFAVIKDKERKSKLVDHVKKRKEKKKKNANINGEDKKYQDMVFLIQTS